MDGPSHPINLRAMHREIRFLFINKGSKQLIYQNEQLNHFDKSEAGAR